MHNVGDVYRFTIRRSKKNSGFFMYALMKTRALRLQKEGVSARKVVVSLD